MKRLIACFILIILSLFPLQVIAEEKPSITLDSDYYSIPIGKSINIHCIITPKNKSKLEWLSANEDIAFVNNKGIVKAVSEGETEITVRVIDNPELTVSCKVKVYTPVKKITFSDKTILIPVSSTWKINATIEPANATNKSLVWTSSNENVAVVSKNGIITGFAKGSTKITAASTDGSNVKTTINVKVADYHIVFTSPFTQQAEYTVAFNGSLSTRGSVKKGNVCISNADHDIGGGSPAMKQSFNVTPLKSGTDVVTLKILYGNKLNFDIFIHPDTFKMQDLGFGQGAVITPGELGVFNGHTYQIFKDKCTWSEAKEKCEKAGGHLVTITSSDEQKYIELLNYQNKALWMGLRKGNGGIWNWITKEDLFYTNWANREPNDSATREFPFENVGVMKPAWYDYHENNLYDTYGYICEWDEIIVDVESVEYEGEVIEPDWIGVYDDHTYQIFVGKYTWNEAKEKCESLGGHLMTINDPSEHRFLKRLNKLNRTLWIGLHKENDESWKWITDEKYTISIWNAGQPDNSYSREFPYENAVAANSGWNDYHKNNTEQITGFICEWDSITDEAKAIQAAKENKKAEENIIEKGKKGVFNGHTYIVSDDIATWSLANGLCEEAKGHLATITSKEEQVFIEKLLDKQYDVWIGLQKDDALGWKWVTGERYSYTNWENGIEEKWYRNQVYMNPTWAFADSHDKKRYLIEWDNENDNSENESIANEKLEKQTNDNNTSDIKVFNGHSYKVFDQSVSWTTAKETCEKEGGHLVTITSPEENNFLVDIAENKNIYWIGMRLNEKSYNIWVTGEDTVYTNFARGEPDNYRGNQGYCALMTQGNRGRTKWCDLEESGISWDGDPFWSNNGFICEWDNLLE